MLVGMVAMTGQWWLDSRTPDKRAVAAHLVNLAWNGLTGGLQKEPELRSGGARSIPRWGGTTRVRAAILCVLLLRRFDARCRMPATTLSHITGP